MPKITLATVLQEIEARIVILENKKNKSHDLDIRLGEYQSFKDWIDRYIDLYGRDR